MPQEARLTRSLLAAYRPLQPVAVAEGLAAGFPRRRPAGYLLHPRAQVGSAVAGRPAAPAGPGVAVLQIRGAMTSEEEWFDCGEAANYPEITTRYCESLVDPGACALVVDASTPGGDVPGLEEAIEIMVAAKAASGRPVLGYVGKLCASGGVWLLSRVCDAIYVHTSARMGSVGVIIGHETDARRAAAEGYDRTLVRDPAGKANPNPDELLDDLGRARLQALVTETRVRFVDAVATSRGIDPAVILGWNGGMFTGAEIVQQKLASGLGSLETTIALAAELAGYQEAA